MALIKFNLEWRLWNNSSPVFFGSLLVCLDFHAQTVEVAFEMAEERMHLIYKVGHWVHRPTRLSKHHAASRQRLAGRSSNHIFHLDTHSHASTLTHTHTHTNTHVYSVTSGVSTLDTPCRFPWRAKQELSGKVVNLVGKSCSFFVCLFAETSPTNIRARLNLTSDFRVEEDFS